MVLGGKDDAFHTGVDQRLRPLLAVKPGGVEGSRVGIAVPPLAIVEGVQTKMDEGIRFHLLPLYLFLFGNGQNRLRRFDVRRRTRCHSQSHGETGCH